MKAKLASILVAVFLISSAALVAADRPHKGKVVRVDSDAKVLVVQSEKGDRWTLYWTESTKFKDGLTDTEIRPGDTVEFDYMEKDGRMYLSELEREHKGENH
jgi:hypothetical protein